MPIPGPDHRHTSRLRVAAVGTYPPRQCGIATFTRDLLDCVEPHAEVFAAALEEPGGFHRYPQRVHMTASSDRRSDYRDLPIASTRKPTS